MPSAGALNSLTTGCLPSDESVAVKSPSPLTLIMKRPFLSVTCFATGSEGASFFATVTVAYASPSFVRESSSSPFSLKDTALVCAVIVELMMNTIIRMPNLVFIFPIIICVKFCLLCCFHYVFIYA